MTEKEIIACLRSWEDVAFDKQSGFMDRFCPRAWELTQVSWDSENMRIVYVLASGQHIADSVKITEWLEFRGINQ